MKKKALFVWGGWEGHRPRACIDVLAPSLAERGFEIELSATLDTFEDADHLHSCALIVPVWTMGLLTALAEENLVAAIRSGVGLAGWHGGMCDAFRQNTEYQFMTGGQFVAHPGGIISEYEIEPNVAVKHPIIDGISNFTMCATEQYYLQVDPSNQVLATTTFFAEDDRAVEIPAVWTRQWGLGRVAYASFGHTEVDFEIAEAKEIVVRCMTWVGGEL